MKHKILTGIGIALGLTVVIVVSLVGSGKIFQGALYNLRPIYRECRIEGANGNLSNAEDCEYFFKKLEDSQTSNQTFLADGEYTVIAKYSDPKLSDNIIPIRIKNKKMECTYLESGYKPQISITDPSNPLTSELMVEPREIPVGSNGLLAQVNFIKNGQTYPYDDNICEGGFRATIFDSNKKILGEAKLDRNTFVSSRPLVNELMISNRPYYGTNLTNFDPGNIYMSLNFDPELLFKFTIPCSNKVPKVQIPDLTTNTDQILKITGLTPDYLKTCSSKLYWIIQNANQEEDLHHIELPTTNGADYLLQLKNIPSVIKPGPVFPMMFILSLHIKDQIDAKEETMLGKGMLTITGNKPVKHTETPTPSSITTPNSTNKPKVKVIPATT